MFAYFNRGNDCAMIGHTQFFLWSRYSDIISLLTITLRGVSNKHCLFPFFIYIGLRFPTRKMLVTHSNQVSSTGPYDPLIIFLS